KDRRLLLLVHHLAVDGVSWHILLSDLAAAWKAMVRGETPALEPEATSFRRWSEYLTESARRESLRSELRYWERNLSGAQVLPGKFLDPARDNIASAGNLRITLPSGLTTALLTSVPQVFHAQINDVLLTGLAIALLQWRRFHRVAGDPTLVIDLEGHGGELMDSGLDLWRTVGWFTSIFPVRLDLEGINLDQAMNGQAAVGLALKQVKDQLRAVPANGFNYGSLRYLIAEWEQQLSA